MEAGIIAICAFLASVLTFFSGFGIGTFLMPVVAIFFPLPVAIGLTAIVHCFHGLLRMGMLWKSIHWKVALRFGFPSLASAVLGAWMLDLLAKAAPVKKYTFLAFSGEISLLKIIIGSILIAIVTLHTFAQKNPVVIKNLMIGGILSGFLGGLSGHQGAVRSMFLIHSHLNKKAFIGTNAAIGLAVDIVRLVVYAAAFRSLALTIDRTLLGMAVGASLAGVLVGFALLKNVTLVFISWLITVLVYMLGFLLILGLI